MKLSIYSLKKILFEGEAELLTCNTEMGVITVLNHHQPLISMLTKGTARIVDSSKKEHFFDIKSGFLEVKRGNKVRCLVD